MVRPFNISDVFLLLTGLQWTIALSGVAFVCGSIGGFAVALARVSPFVTLRVLAGLWIEIFQGTPLLLQLFVVYYGIAFLNIDLNPWIAVAIGLTLHGSAYLGEIWRGSIEAIPRGQSEAAYALGLRYPSRMAYVLLPQAFMIGLPATVGFLVQLIKGTSLAAIIGFAELARQAQVVSNLTYQPLLAYGVAAIFYFMLCWPLSLASGRLEARNSKTHR